MGQTKVIYYDWSSECKGTGTSMGGGGAGGDHLSEIFSLLKDLEIYPLKTIGSHCGIPSGKSHA